MLGVRYGPKAEPGNVRLGWKAGIARFGNRRHSNVMWKAPDLRPLWVLGAVLLVLGGFGILAAGAIVGLPILLGTAALGYSVHDGLRLLVWASPLWVPIGAGMGMLVTSRLVKGLRPQPPG